MIKFPIYWSKGNSDVRGICRANVQYSGRGYFTQITRSIMPLVIQCRGLLPRAGQVLDIHLSN